MSDFPLQGKIALVTGGSRGIGRAVVKRFAQLGAEVAVNFATRLKAAQVVREEVEKSGQQALLVQGSIAIAEEAEAVVEKTLKEFGRIDILVNNAGISRDNMVMVMPPADWQVVIDTNLTGVYRITKLVLRSMVRQRSGTIINISSAAGLIGLAGSANYCAAKEGVLGFTRALAREVASYGIRVNAVAPGFVDTEFIAGLPEKQRQNFIDQSLLHRFGTPEEIAAGVFFLASPAARYITGQTLVIDGGLSLAMGL